MNPEIIEKLMALLKKGDHHSFHKRYGEAASHYQEALELLPAPAMQWEASIWVLIALGDTYYHLGEFDKAIRFLDKAQESPRGQRNAFIHLRRGQCFLDLGNHDGAAEELLKVIELDGKDLFYDEDTRFLDFLEHSPLWLARVSDG